MAIYWFMRQTQYGVVPKLERQKKQDCRSKTIPGYSELKARLSNLARLSQTQKQKETVVQGYSSIAEHLPSITERKGSNKNHVDRDCGDNETSQPRLENAVRHNSFVSR